MKKQLPRLAAIALAVSVPFASAQETATNRADQSEKEFTGIR